MRVVFSAIENTTARTRRRNVAAWLLAGLLACSVGGCGGAADGNSDAGREWESETTTAGNVTTVRTLAGSVWGAPARLEEELSIGVEQGDDAYMFGHLQGVSGTGDRIYVLDTSVPAVRVYDDNGGHLLDVGAEGDGPGEFRQPDAMLVAPDGRIFVRDSTQGRITVFDAAGELIETWPLDRGFVIGGGAMVLADDGKLYNPGRVGEMPEEMSVQAISSIQMGMVPRGPDGQAGDAVPRPQFDYEPPRFTRQVQTGGNFMIMMRSVPFAPDIAWTFSPSGAMIAGVADDYGFDIAYPGGAVTRVEKVYEPVAIAAAERDWHIEQVTAQMREGNPEWKWEGPEMATVKPAYRTLLADLSGRIWVIRPGVGVQNTTCEKDPETGAWDPDCWSDGNLYEVFDLEGAYLGQVEAPEGFHLSQWSWIEGDEVLTQVEDAAGVITVKRYRVVRGER